MFNRLQVAGAVFLLALSSAFGQAGLLQCLCTGEVSFTSPAVEECIDCCCRDHDESPTPDGMPSPCDDGSCFLLITLHAVDPITASATALAPDVGQPAAHGEVPLIAPRTFSDLQAADYRPPDRQPVPLTVLFSSFLI